MEFQGKECWLDGIRLFGEELNFVATWVLKSKSIISLASCTQKKGLLIVKNFEEGDVPSILKLKIVMMLSLVTYLFLRGIEVTCEFFR